MLALIAGHAPIEDWEVESCLLAELYRRRITTFTFYKPGKDRRMKLALTASEAYALHYLLGREPEYNEHLRTQVEPKLLPPKSAMK